MARLLRIAAIVCGVVLLAGLAGVWFVYRASQRPVAWYDEVLDVQPPEAGSAGDEMERRALALVSDLKRPTDRWEAIFTDQQLNGWLAEDLAKKHGGALPEGVSQPRVRFDPGGARVACRYETPQFTTVLNLQTEVYLTDEPNVVAVRIRNARAGALPLPLKRFMDTVTEAANRQGIGLRWTEEEGDPLALIDLPTEHREVKGRLLLKQLVLREGEIYLSGSTTARNGR